MNLYLVVLHTKNNERDQRLCTKSSSLFAKAKRIPIMQKYRVLFSVFCSFHWGTQAGEHKGSFKSSYRRIPFPLNMSKAPELLSVAPSVLFLVSYFPENYPSCCTYTYKKKSQKMRQSSQAAASGNSASTDPSGGRLGIPFTLSTLTISIADRLKTSPRSTSALISPSGKNIKGNANKKWAHIYRQESIKPFHCLGNVDIKVGPASFINKSLELMFEARQIRARTSSCRPVPPPAPGGLSSRYDDKILKTVCCNMEIYNAFDALQEFLICLCGEGREEREGRM